MEQPEPDPVRVLFIAGGFRSGSTLMDVLLGQIPGFVAIGELRQIWQQARGEKGRCGCGQRFLECQFWTRVGELAFGGWSNVDLQELSSLRERIDRLSAIPRLLGSKSATGDLARYLDSLSRVLSAIRVVSGSEVIVDSSKSPAHALLLAKIPGAEVRAVHVVRDSRGVAFSWRRGFLQRLEAARRSGEGVERGRIRPRRSTASASIRWMAFNGLAPAVRRAGIPYLRLRYEDLISDPRVNLARALDHAAVPGGMDLSFVGDGSVTLGVTHTAFGSNRTRFRTGEVPLLVDEEWRRAMPAADWLIATGLTLPFLLRYGYRVTRAV